MPIRSGVSVFLLICGISIVCTAGIAYALLQGMELLGRLAAVVGISLVLTLLLLVLYQDDAAQAQEPGPSTAITQAASATANGAP
ncbi:MAG TPA: hypothetical protein VFB85_22635 [Vicinamibacterales bacterium]|nr:hypothetical protein [Vicinamibacterales bacterium]